MVDGFFFGPIHLIQEAIFLDECDEVGLYILLNFGLSFLDWFHMGWFNLLVLFEHLPNLFWCLSLCLFVKLVQIWVFFNKVWVVLDCVHDNVKQGDGSASIGSVLFHVEKIGGDFVIFKIFGLLLEEGFLLFVYFVQKDNTKNRFDEHVLGPLFEWEKFLNWKLLNLEAWIRKEVPSFLMN